jgi:hypothetical protein
LRKVRLAKCIGLIDDELIEKADEYIFPVKRDHYSWRKILKPAVCFITVIAVICGMKLWVSVTYKPPEFKYASFTASDLDALFPLMNDGATRSYTSVYTNSFNNLGINVSLDASSLPVYKRLNSTKDVNEFRGIADKYLSLFCNNIGESVPKYVIEKGSGLYYHTEITAAGYRLFLSEYGVSISGIDYYDRVNVGGKDVYIYESYSDEEIISSISDAITFAKKSFGVDYTGISIKREYSSYELNYIAVSIYNKNSDKVHKTSNGILNNAITLKFNTIRNGRTDEATKEAFCYSISYNWSDLQILGEYSLIPLATAEKMLKNGFVFGGHACNLCMQAQAKVDFTNYNAVAYEYIVGDNGYVIPFYAFYKYTGKSIGGYETYAKTYVPAIEVSGLREYFDKQEANHFK